MHAAVVLLHYFPQWHNANVYKIRNLSFLKRASTFNCSLLLFLLWSASQTDSRVVGEMIHNSLKKKKIKDFQHVPLRTFYQLYLFPNGDSESSYICKLWEPECKCVEGIKTGRSGSEQPELQAGTVSQCQHGFAWYGIWERQSERTSHARDIVSMSGWGQRFGNTAACFQRCQQEQAPRDVFKMHWSFPSEGDAVPHRRTASTQRCSR